MTMTYLIQGWSSYDIDGTQWCILLALFMANERAICEADGLTFCASPENSHDIVTFTE
jgi:hypothetical protein